MKLAKIDEQYKKFPEIKKEDVEKILDWANKQPHLPKITGEEYFFKFSFYYKKEYTFNRNRSNNLFAFKLLQN